MSAQPDFLPQTQFPPQNPSARTSAPERQWRLTPDPETIREDYFGNARLRDRVALITGGDSGIGRAVAVHFAREGARVVVVHEGDDEEARECQRLVRAEGSDCLLVHADLGNAEACREAVARSIDHFGHLDILVNDGVERHPLDQPDDLTAEQVERAFRGQVFYYLLISVEALSRLRRGGSIINTAPMVGAHANQKLRDYAAGNGAIHAFTVSLAEAAVERGIRVNAVAPGPIRTPLMPSGGSVSPPPGSQTLMKRAGLPAEVAPAYVFLASDDATFITGQTIHVNGGGHIGA